MQIQGLSFGRGLREDDMLVFVFLSEFECDSGGGDEDGEQKENGKENIYTLFHSLSNLPT